MFKIEKTVVINKPLEEVFAYTWDHRNDAKWQSGIVSTKYQDGELKVGSQFTAVRKFMGREVEGTVEITALEKNKRYAAKSIDGPMKFDMDVTYEGANGSTTMTTSINGDAGSFFKIAEGMVAKNLEKSLGDDLNKLKSILEG